MVPVVGPQPMFWGLGNGRQVSTNGTSQTFWPVAPPSGPTTSRVQVALLQSPSFLQNLKQRAKQLSWMQTSSGPQLSVWPASPSESIEQASITAFGKPFIRGWLHVSMPAVLPEHFSRQPAQ